ncbi:MAG: protein kinase [Planctomycetes bacterium]|nr:protein kinase [Planctomycetota bacterium]
MPTAADQTLPRRAGGFELRRELGRGGMGIVYEAQELASGRRVALKVLLADLTLSDEAFERFRREARIAASLSDSRCVFVYGAHEIEGSPAIAMELVGGETLEQRLARGVPIPIEQAVRWTIEILEGLEAAADSGIVHRDVKPSNCFLTEDGHVKVGDFGLARTVQADLQLTRSGQFLGSPLYASPEQVKGREVDQRSDLYSCGATLYALLTGRAPHSGTNLGEVLANILSESPPSPRELRPDVARGLARVVMKALERDPKRRFQTHAELRAALLVYVSNSSLPASRLKRVAAFLLDLALLWMIASLVGKCAMLLDASLLDRLPKQSWRFANPVIDGLFVLGYVLYFAAFETWLSTTPAKWILGLHVVAARADFAHRARTALRALVFFSPPLARDVYMRIANPEDSNLGLVIGMGGTWLGLLMLVSMRRGNGWRGLHEFASGTRTIQRRHPFASTKRAAPPPDAPLAAYSAMPARVGEYSVQGAIGRTPWGILLKARDEALERSVWMLELEPGRAQVPEERRVLQRGGRVRWLAALEVGERKYEVFEDPGGTSLLACAARGIAIPFATQRRMLTSLAQELAESGDEPLSLHRLWIDRSWSVRVLDASAGDAPTSEHAPSELLVRAARALLPQGSTLPSDLPESAEPVARKLYGLEPPFAELVEARNALASLEARPVHVSRRARAVQVAFSSGPVLLPTAFLVAGAILFATSMETQSTADLLATSLVRGTTPVDEGAIEGSTLFELRPLTNDERRARQILLSDWKRNHEPPFVKPTFSKEARAQVDHAVELYPSASDQEVEWARGARGPIEIVADASGDGPRGLAVVTPLIATGIGWAFTALGALRFGGGFSFALAELRLRDRRGRRASRWTFMARSTLAATVLAAVYAPAWILHESVGPAAAWIALLLGVAAHAALIAHAFVDPSRGLHDRVLGTRIVPR